MRGDQSKFAAAAASIAAALALAARLEAGLDLTGQEIHS